MKRLLLLATLAFAALPVSAATAASPRTITVSGSGVAATVATQADFTFGVSALGGTATAALHANATEMTKVIAALKAHGVAAADIQTAEISLTPNRNRNGSKILNYTATN